MAITDEQTTNWYDDAVSRTELKKEYRSTLRDSGTVLGEAPTFDETPTEEIAPTTTQDMTTSPTDEAKLEARTAIRDGVLSDSFGEGLSEPTAQTIQPIEQPQVSAPVLSDPNLTAGGAQIASNFGGGSTAEYNTQAAGTTQQITPPPTTAIAAPVQQEPAGQAGVDYNEQYGVTMYTVPESLDESYFTSNGSIKSSYDQYAANIGNYANPDLAINAFVVDNLRNGWTAQDIDSEMGWAAGTTQKWIQDNGIGVQNKIGASGLYQAPTNNAQVSYNGMVRAVNAGLMSGEEAVNVFMSQSLAGGYTPEQLASALQLDQSVIDGWIDSNQYDLGGGDDGVLGGDGTGPTVTGTGGTGGTAGIVTPDGQVVGGDGTIGGGSIQTPVGGQTGQAGTVPSMTSPIAMLQGTNVGATNVVAASEMARGTLAQDAQVIAEWGDVYALYEPKGIPLVSTTLAGLLEEDSVYMKAIQNQSLEQMSGLGRVGDSAHAGAAAKAAIEAALPIAQGDVDAAAFNAKAYNHMMDSRQSQVYGIANETLRGSQKYLDTMLNDINALIGADIDYNRERAGKKLDSDLAIKRDNINNAASLWENHQSTKAIINDSALSPEAKADAIAADLESTISGINLLGDMANNISGFDLEDFGYTSGEQAVLSGSSSGGVTMGDGGSVANVNIGDVSGDASDELGTYMNQYPDLEARSQADLVLKSGEVKDWATWTAYMGAYMQDNNYFGGDYSGEWYSGHQTEIKQAFAVYDAADKSNDEAYGRAMLAFKKSIDGIQATIVDERYGDMGV